MTKAERAKMRDRVSRVFPTFTSCGGAFEEICELVACEVDRAVRAERKAQRDTEELWESHRRRADERLIDGMKRVGRKS